MLNDTCPGSLHIRIIHCCISLEIRFIQCLVLKTHGTILQSSQLIVKIRINGTCVNHLLRHCIVLLFFLQIILIQPYLDTVQQIGNHLRITTHRYSLIQRIEIVIVKGQTHRKPLDDKSRKLRTWTSPLLLRVALDQLLINIRTYKADSLFLQI